MKTLYLYSHGFPDPDGHTTVDRLAWHYLHTLADQGPVDLFALLPFSKRSMRPPTVLASRCRAIHAFPSPPSRVVAFFRLITGLLSRTPPMLGLKWNSRAVRFLQDALVHDQYDLWIANSPLAMGLIPAPLLNQTRKQKGRPRLILATEEVLWRAWQGYRLSSWSSLGVSMIFHSRFHRWMARAERNLARLADRVLCLSQREADSMTSLDPSLPTRLIPLFVDTAVFRPAPVPPEPEILFTGFFGHPPNMEAALELGRSIWPTLRTRFPHARLHLAGRGASSLRHFLSDPAIRISDSVPSLVSLYQHAAAVVGPIRSGEGVRGKFLEALACGCPVITTALGASGIQAGPAQGLFIADTPEDFVTKTIPFLQNPVGYDGLRRDAAENIRRHHSKEAWRATFETILAELFPAA